MLLSLVVSSPRSPIRLLAPPTASSPRQFPLSPFFQYSCALLCNPIASSSFVSMAYTLFAQKHRGGVLPSERPEGLLAKSSCKSSKRAFGEGCASRTKHREEGSGHDCRSCRRLQSASPTKLSSKLSESSANYSCVFYALLRHQGTPSTSYFQRRLRFPFRNAQRRIASSWYRRRP